jgi:hypothetical protein
MAAKMFQAAATELRSRALSGAHQQDRNRESKHRERCLRQVAHDADEIIVRSNPLC